MHIIQVKLNKYSLKPQLGLYNRLNIVKLLLEYKVVIYVVFFRLFFYNDLY